MCLLLLFIDTTILNFYHYSCPVGNQGVVGMNLVDDVRSEPVTLIINDILMSGKVPSLLKKAEDVPVAKNNNLDTFKDYRPISLLYHLRKIAERFISHKIQEAREFGTLLISMHTHTLINVETQMP